MDRSPLVRLLGDDADGVVTHIQGGIVVGNHGSHLLQNGILGPLDQSLSCSSVSASRLASTGNLPTNSGISP